MMKQDSASNKNAWDEVELSEMIARELWGKHTEEESAAFRDLIQSDEKARLFYIRYVYDTRTLATFSQGGDDVTANEPIIDMDQLSRMQGASPQISRPRRQVTMSLWMASSIAAAIVLLVLLPFTMQQNPSVSDAGSESGLGRANDQRQPEVNTIQFVHLKQSDIKNISMESGAQVTIQGKATYAILDGETVLLQAGKLVGHVPEEAGGLIVQTGEATVIDTGTHFAVERNEQEETEVHVFDGEVKLLPRRHLRTPNAVVSLGKGQARKMSFSEIKTIEFDAQRFEMLRKWRKSKLRVLADKIGDLLKYEAFDYLVDQRPKLSRSLATSLDRQWSVYTVKGVGAQGVAVGFDGRQSIISKVYHSPFKQVRKDFTIGFWFKSESAEGKPVTMISTITNKKSNFGWRIDLDHAGKVQIVMNQGQDSEALFSSSRGDLNDGNWHHLVWSRSEGGGNQLYVDGELAGELTDESQSKMGRTYLTLGGLEFEEKLSQFFRGSLDEMVIFAKVLTPEQVGQLYQIGKP